jgi:hypothetical protein
MLSSFSVVYTFRHSVVDSMVVFLFAVLYWFCLYALGFCSLCCFLGFCWEVFSLPLLNWCFMYPVMLLGMGVRKSTSNCAMASSRYFQFHCSFIDLRFDAVSENCWQRVWIDKLSDHFVYISDYLRVCKIFIFLQMWIRSGSETQVNKYFKIFLWIKSTLFRVVSKFIRLPSIIMAVPYKAWTTLTHSNTRVACSNVSVCLFCFLSCPVCNCSLATDWSPVQEILPTIYRIEKLKIKYKGSRKCCSAIMMHVMYAFRWIP